MVDKTGIAIRPIGLLLSVELFQHLKLFIYISISSCHTETLLQVSSALFSNTKPKCMFLLVFQSFSLDFLLSLSYNQDTVHAALFAS